MTLIKWRVLANLQTRTIRTSPVLKWSSCPARMTPIRAPPQVCLQSTWKTKKFGQVSISRTTQRWIEAYIRKWRSFCATISVQKTKIQAASNPWLLRRLNLLVTTITIVTSEWFLEEGMDARSSWRFVVPSPLENAQLARQHRWCSLRLRKMYFGISRPRSYGQRKWTNIRPSRTRLKTSKFSFSARLN